MWAPYPWLVRIAILGPLELRRNGGAVAPGGRRVAALLARLALDCGRLVPASALIDAVWEEQLPADPSHALQTLVSRLRRELEADALTQESGGYLLALDPEAVDAIEFERLAADGAAALREGDATRAAGLLDAALDLWRGPALAGLTSDHRFAAAEASRLEDRRLSARADRIAAGLALGRGAELLGDRLRDAGLDPEAEHVAEAEHHHGQDRVAHHVGHDGADERRRAPDREAAEAVEDALLEIPAEVDADGDAAESDRLPRRPGRTNCR